MANNTILAMNALQSNIIREITPLSDKDCFYIAERYKTEFTYPIHNHAEFELNFTEKAAGVRRIVGDSAEVISDYDLVLITGKDLEHVWEQHDCHSKEIREITIQFSSDLFFKSFINKNQFDSIRDMLEKAQKGLCFPMSAILKIYPLLDTLASEKQGFYAVIKFLTILYELSLFNEEARTLSSSSFAKIGIHSDSRRVQKVQEYINAHYQEEIRLNQLADMVGKGCTLASDCIRTWIFVQNVDVNYAGIVKARRENFLGQGLTESTHYIASTGIEGRHADPKIQVLFDAYAVKGLQPGQVTYLHALSHLSPTALYGVTFERGTSVEYGDRRHLFISGTASIDHRGEVVHVGDVREQTRRMWENVEKLLEEGKAGFEDVAQMIVYLRDASDYPVVRALFAKRFPDTPIQFVVAAVCRPAWLIEMECIAIVANSNSSYESF